MAELIEWPADLLRVVDATYFIRTQGRSAGRGLSGHEQVISSDTGTWMVSLTLAQEFDGERMRRFEAQVAMMRGRLNAALLPICDPFRYGERVAPSHIRHSDTTLHSDGTGAFAGSGVEPMKTAAAVSAGASQMTTILTDPSRPSLRVGDFFSHAGWLYQVVRRNDGGWVRFEPPLRAPIAGGQTLLTDPPLWRARFATDDEGMRIRELLRWGSQITLNFVEDFDR